MNQKTQSMSTKEKIVQLLKSHNITVQAVKSMGFGLYISHSRNVGDIIEPIYTTLSEIRKNHIQDYISARGGITTAELIDNETGITIMQRAKCSVYDPYVKSVGINYALRRALRDLYNRLNHKENSSNSE